MAIQPLLCHLLIGLPGSGKSTFAKQLQAQIPRSIVISTDTIRSRLFGDEAIQGDWNRIESEVIEQVNLAIEYEQPIIYDATNVKLEWRSSFLTPLQYSNTEWIAWWIKTSVDICKQRNKKRCLRLAESPTCSWQTQSRQVPDDVIDVYEEYLQTSPPAKEEGFIAVRIVD